MNRKTFSLILVFALAYFSATLFFQPQIKSVLRVPSPAPPPITSATKREDEGLRYPCAKDQTVFDLLQKNAAGVETKDYSFGKLVTTINGIKGGIDGKFWTYFVDDQAATVSADNYKCVDSEKVEWKFGKENQ